MNPPSTLVPLVLGQSEFGMSWELIRGLEGWFLN